MARTLRPLTLGKMLDETFDIYRHNFLLFLSISAIPNVVLLLLQLELSRWMERDVLKNGPLGWLAVLSVPLATLFIGSIVTAATTIGVSEIYLDRPADVWSCFSRISRKALRIVYVSFLLQLIVGIGMLFCFIPGIYWAGVYGLTIPAVVLENIGAHRSLGRSSGLTQNSVGRVVLVYFMASIFTWLMVSALNAGADAVGFPFPFHGFLTREMLKEINTTLGNVVFGPLSAIALTLEYYDQRVRKEAFDLEHMMSLMHAPESMASGVSTT